MVDNLQSSEATEEEVSLISMELTTSALNYHLDAASVQVTTGPITVIKYYEKDALGPSNVSFNVFLPDAYFTNILELTKVGHLREMRYQFSFQFNGFMPRKVPEHPDLITYE
jgi:hypothetical protein